MTYTKVNNGQKWLIPSSYLTYQQSLTVYYYSSLKHTLGFLNTILLWFSFFPMLFPPLSSLLVFANCSHHCICWMSTWAHPTILLFLFYSYCLGYHIKALDFKQCLYVNDFNVYILNQNLIPEIQAHKSNCQYQSLDVQIS